MKQYRMTCSFANLKNHTCMNHEIHFPYNEETFLTDIYDFLAKQLGRVSDGIRSLTLIREEKYDYIILKLVLAMEPSKSAKTDDAQLLVLLKFR